MFYIPEIWFTNSWLTWGVGPILAANLGAWPLGIFLEWYIRQIPKSQLVAWKGGSGSRMIDANKTREKVSFNTQLFSKKGGVMTICGPGALFGGIISSLIFNFVVGMEWVELTPLRFIYEVILMEIVGDLGLYWGHRIQHQIPYLYKHYHSIHHTLDTPTPLGAIYIHEIDAFLQASLPIFIAGLAVRGHPVSYYTHITLRIAQNIYNHSGLDDFLFALIFLRFDFLGRAKPSHHDTHHKYGGHSVNPMNLGENFWLWDWIFGTYVDRSLLQVNHLSD